MEVKKDAPSRTFLNIGSQVLVKDQMDLLIRKIGNHKTHYSMTAESALRLIETTIPDFILMEFELSDSNSYRLIKEFRQMRSLDGVYYVLVADEENPQLTYIAQEMDVQSVLLRPITGDKISAELEKFNQFLLNPDSAQSILRKAQAALRDKAFHEADKLFKRALELAPQDIRVQYRVGMYYLQKPDFVAAEKHLTAALEMDKHFVPALAALGMHFWKIKKYKRAFVMLAEAQALSPLNPDRALLLAKIHLSWGAEELQAARNRDPHNPDLRFMLGKFAVFQKDYVRAVQEFDEAELDSKHPDFEEMDTLKKFAKKMGSLQ